MIQSKNAVALLTSGLLAVSALSMPSAHAATTTSKKYKTGAIVLGAIGAYMAVKGKTVPAAIAGAGAYYAYKKSKDARREYSYNDDDDRYAQRDSQRDSQRDADIGYEDANRDSDDLDNNDLGYDALSKTAAKTVEPSRTKTLVND